MPTKVLVVGGAGFIGSHMTLLLKERGYTPIVFDNFLTGHQTALHDECVKGDLTERGSIARAFEEHDFSAVLHFAASTHVGESVEKPDFYYRNNVLGTLNLLSVMLEKKVHTLIFSSTAAVYGNPVRLPIDESHPKNPLNPYGETKWAVEKILEDYQRAYDFRFIAFRYFNAAGSDPRCRTGERRDPPAHLIPIVLQVAKGKSRRFSIFGMDYPTKDGTCIRDFVHVNDLCQAHLLGLERLLDGKEGGVYNLGSGRGFSVLEVIQEARRITGKEIEVVAHERRPGDSIQLVAACEKAKKELGWRPKFSDLESMIGHTWQWYTQATR